MFQTFSTITLLGLLTLSAAQAQSEQPIHAKVPFAFTVQNTTLAAGTYRLTYKQTAHILSIRGLDQNPGAVFTLAVPSTDANGPAKLVFNCYGKTCYLARVWQGDHAGGRGLQLSQNEKQRKLSFLTRVVSITVAAK
jgi:hypothetical protein